MIKRRGPLRLRDRSTGDILVLLIAFTITSILGGVTTATVAYVFLNPGQLVEGPVRLITDMMNTLIGLLAGFMVGRTRTVVSRDGATLEATSDNEAQYLNTSDALPNQQSRKQQYEGETQQPE